MTIEETIQSKVSDLFEAALKTAHEKNMKRVPNPASGRRERLTKAKGDIHRHTDTFRRCIKKLEGKGYDAGGSHRICYSVGAGGEGYSGAAKRAKKGKR